MRARSRILSALAFGVAPFALAAPASAAPPTVETFHFEGTEPFAECEGFDIDVNFSVDAVVRTFYNNAGEPIREQAHIHGKGEIVNTVTGASNTGSSPQNVIVDLEAGTVTTVGLVFHNNVPGEGIVCPPSGKVHRRRGRQRIVQCRTSARF